MPTLLLLTAAIVAGTAAALRAPVPATLALSLAVALAALAVPLPAGRGRQGFIVSALAALAAAHAADVRDRTLAPPLGIWFAQRPEPASGNAARGASEPLRLRGVLREDASVGDSGAVRLVVVVAAVQPLTPGAGWQPAPGVVRLFVQGEAALAVYDTWTRGRTVDVTASLRWPPVPRNPGGPHPIVARLVRGYVLAGTVKSAALVTVTPGPWWQERAAALRRHVRRSTAAVPGGDDRRVTAAVVTAILIGDRAGLDRATTDRLIAAGTYHVVAISGGNIALVTLAVAALLRRLLRSPRLVSAGALLAVVMYGWTIGGEPSVTRAVTAAVVWLAADVLGLRVAPVRLFALVVIAVVAWDPLMVIAPGAWLSFDATLGIILCVGRLVEWMVPAVGSSPGRWRRRLRVVATLGAATLAAELMLLPVSAWTFSRVSVAGLPLNFIAIPAMAAVQAAGVLVVVCTPLVPALAHAAGAVAHLATILLVDSSRLVDWIPSLAWRVPPPSPIVMAGYYVAVGIVIVTRGRAWWRRAAGLVAAGLLVVMATGPGLLLARPAAGTLRATILDAGQGDAIVVQFPDGHVLVVDAGPAGETFDTGERIVTPALWALGARVVDWVAFTHADLDHIGGVAAVVREFAAREVWEGVPVIADDNRRALYDVAQARRVPWRQLRAGDRLEIGGAELAVLHPPEPDWERPRVRNDDSIVLRVRYGALELLLTGDISEAVERTLSFDDTSRGAIRVLKVAHHGSRTSTSAAFVERFRPWAAIIGVGRNNTFGHPVPDVLDRLAAAGATTLRTDRDGAVKIESDGETVWMRTWRGRTWRAVTRPPP
ncbi:MAG: DNA internalization-related competence protein ComEC/Rec2 [Acidobacteria bacterium SCN 69-37]|nr:MAG: DNA internalization-related competence protein ComEC/Rec2 [Acidobacteria bacterium SCN 69-37]